MTIQNLTDEYLTFEQVLTPTDQLSDNEIDLFLAFHDAAVAKSKGNLRPTTKDDILQADFVAVVKNEDGSIQGQCLVTKGDNKKAEKIANYPSQTKTDNALIITSLAGKKAMPTLFEHIREHAIEIGISSLFAKAKAENACAKDIFEGNGFTAEGPQRMQGDNYNSYLYVQELLTNASKSTQQGTGLAAQPAL